MARLVVPRKAKHTLNDDDDNDNDKAKSIVLRDSDLIAFRARLDSIVDSNEEFKLIYTKILDSLTTTTISIDNNNNNNKLLAPVKSDVALSREQPENLKKKLKFKLSRIIICLRKNFAIKYSINMKNGSSTTSNDFGSLSDSMAAKRLNAEYQVANKRIVVCSLLFSLFYLHVFFSFLQVALLNKLYKPNRTQLMRVFYKINDMNENGDETCEVTSYSIFLHVFTHCYSVL